MQPIHQFIAETTLFVVPSSAPTHMTPSTMRTRPAAGCGDVTVVVGDSCVVSAGALDFKVTPWMASSKHGSTNIDNGGGLQTRVEVRPS